MLGIIDELGGLNEFDQRARFDFALRRITAAIPSTQEIISELKRRTKLPWSRICAMYHAYEANRRAWADDRLDPGKRVRMALENFQGGCNV
jgi:hypothetical protein